MDSWNDINLPGFSKSQTGPEKDPQTTDESAQEEQQTVEFKLEKAYWKEGPDGFNFNKKCFVVVEGKFLCKTVRMRIQGDLFCDSEAGLEDLGSHVEGFLDRNTGKAELEVTLYFGNKYYNLLRSKPDAKCDYIVKRIRHTRGDKEIESESLEIPRADVLGLGGVSLMLCDMNGTTVTDCNVIITMGSEELHNGILQSGTFMIDDKPSAPFKIQITTENEPFTFDLPWQRTPLIEQKIILPLSVKENADV